MMEAGATGHGQLQVVVFDHGDDNDQDDDDFDLPFHAGMEALFAAEEAQLEEQEGAGEVEAEVEGAGEEGEEEDDWPPMYHHQPQPQQQQPPAVEVEVAVAVAVEGDPNAAAFPGDGIPPSPPQLPAAPWEDGRMELTTEEMQWAINIKTAIEQCVELDNITDFEYAQMALMVQDDVQAAVERVEHMQAYKEQYGILDTLEHSRQKIPQVVRMMQGLALSLSFNHRDGNYVFVYDIAACDWKKALASHDKTMTLFTGCYYICHALCPDLEAIRRGVILLCECSGFDWRKHMDLATFRKVWCELLVAYPMEYQKAKYFNAGIFINMINSLKKKFLPKRIVDKMETGCQFDGRLSDIYLVPNMEACNQRIIDRIDESLVRRYNNIKNFKLSASSLSSSSSQASSTTEEE